APTTSAAPANRSQAPASGSGRASSVHKKRQTVSGSRSRGPSAPPSRTNSPFPSRDNSPHRHQQRQPASSGPTPKSGLRSRKNSTEASPNRAQILAGTASTVPSAAAIQRALSSANIPSIPPTSLQDPSRLPRPQKASAGTNSGDATPHWPVSPRLKSPPPESGTRSRSRRNSLRSQARNISAASSAPSIVVQSSSPAPTSRIPVVDEGTHSDLEEQPPIMSMKGSSRGASGAVPKLETVQEASLPTSPGFDGLEVQSVPHNSQRNTISEEDSSDVTTSKVTEDLTKASRHPESESDGGVNNPERRDKSSEMRSSSSQRPNMSSKASYSSLSTIKSKAEVPSKNMTVETETVPSIPQAPLVSNQDRIVSGRGEPSGSLRLKPSNETIRPRKERSRPKRKAASINSGTGRLPRSYHHHHHPTASFSGSPISHDDRRSLVSVMTSSPETALRSPPLHSPSLIYLRTRTDSWSRKASSKADVFEAKVASAVDEANSSDSDETFVYESNPPDSQPHRNRHHHSRTPSMTSINSMADPRTVIRDSHRTAGKKSSMKFANNPYNNPDLEDDFGEGTVRGPSGRTAGGPYHHHIGRHGQGRGVLNQHQVLTGDVSGTQSSKTRVISSRGPSQPSSPRFQPMRMQNGTMNSARGNKNGEYSAYDIDSAGVADDERTPLISNIRSPRSSRNSRRPESGSLRQFELHQRRRSSSWCNRVAGGLVLAILLLVLIFSTVGLVFATTKPLYGLKVREVQNVIASQEEIMLDLLVSAVNPNIIGVTIADMDVNIFAKSKHIGSDKWWREHGRRHDNQEDWQHISGPPDEVTVTTRDMVQAQSGIDEGTDPIEDPEVGEPRTMLLGRIFRFDSPLQFEGNFFKHISVESLGELRLPKPGNKTESGGPERWEEVLKYPFELILRGVFKYQLPLSTREHTVPITASYFYEPEKERK
ncbi:hypothetical protein GQ43DRAFT_348202, partial [Delitschia confertaspora ATCC 74209]